MIQGNIVDANNNKNIQGMHAKTTFLICQDKQS